jgi:hypothetical protein
MESWGKKIAFRVNSGLYFAQYQQREMLNFV